MKTNSMVEGLVQGLVESSKCRDNSEEQVKGERERIRESKIIYSSAKGIKGKSHI